jgi:hypothetical protein
MLELDALGHLPWFVALLVVFRPYIRLARTVEGKKSRTEFEIGINIQRKPRDPEKG